MGIVTVGAEKNLEMRTASTFHRFIKICTEPVLAHITDNQDWTIRHMAHLDFCKSTITQQSGEFGGKGKRLWTRRKREASLQIKLPSNNK